MNTLQAKTEILGGEKWHCLEFSSMEQFLKDADVEPSLLFRNTSRSVGDKRFDTTGTANFAEASHLAREGWAEGLARMAELTESIGTVVGSYIVKSEIQYDVAGASVDMGRFVTGEPECMISFTEEVKRGVGGRVVRVSVDVGAAYHVSKENIFRRGAAIVVLVDALERAGLVAEVECIQLIRYRMSRLVIRVPVKKAGEALELDRMAYVLAHASMLRRHVFSVEENQTPEFRRMFNIGGNYGFPLGRIPEALKEEGQISVDGMGQGGYQWGTDEQAIAWVLAQLRAQGVILEGD